MKKFLNINDIEICIDDTEEGENALLLIHVRIFLILLSSANLSHQQVCAQV